MQSTSTVTAGWSFSHWIRLVEFLVLFVAVPLLLVLPQTRVSPLPILWVMGAVCLGILLMDSSFDRGSLVRITDFRKNLTQMLLPIPVLALLMGLLLYYIAPQAVFSTVLERPKLWIVLMLLYPIFSVIPQTIIYRSFFFHRYSMLFGSGWILVVVAALCFALAHLLFRHWVPIMLTLIGGFFFAYRYYVSKSMPLSAIEHAIYGDIAFTLGYGYYLFHGSLKYTQEATGT